MPEPTVSERFFVQLLAQTGEWVNHEWSENEAVAREECAKLTAWFGSVVTFRVVRQRTETHVLPDNEQGASRG